MKYFKDNRNKVYAYESDGSQDAFIKPDLVAITEQEAMALANPPPTPEQVLASQIAEAKAYLDSTDLYFARYLETGEPVPEEIVIKRRESRDFIRANEVKDD